MAYLKPLRQFHARTDVGVSLLGANEIKKPRLVPGQLLQSASDIVCQAGQIDPPPPSPGNVAVEKSMMLVIGCLPKPKNVVT